MKAQTITDPTSEAFTPLAIVSLPKVGPMIDSLMGSVLRAVGRLPALSTSTNSCTCCWVKSPEISPLSKIALLMYGAECR